MKTEEIKLDKCDVVLFRGAEHAILRKGKIGDAPEYSDGEHYSHEQTYFIASISFKSETDAIGYWIPARLLTKTNRVHRFTSEQASDEPSLSDRVVDFLKGNGNKSISEISQNVGKPSAAVFSALSSLTKKSVVTRLEDNTWRLLD